MTNLKSYLFTAEQSEVLQKLGLESNGGLFWWSSDDPSDWSLIDESLKRYYEQQNESIDCFLPAYDIARDIIANRANAEKIWGIDHVAMTKEDIVGDTLGAHEIIAYGNAWEIHRFRILGLDFDQAKQYVIDAAKKRLEEQAL